LSVTIEPSMIPRPRPRLQFNIERTLSWFPPIRAAGKRTEEFITPDLAARFVGYRRPDHGT